MKKIEITEEKELTPEEHKIYKSGKEDGFINGLLTGVLIVFGAIILAIALKNL